MTQEIIEMAMKVGGTVMAVYSPDLQAFAKLVDDKATAREREAFAAHAVDIARRAVAQEREAIIDLVAFYGGPVDLEAAIRARGEL
jgi:hypothetical protein